MFHLLQSFSYLFYDRFVVLIHIMLIFLRSEFQRIPQILDIAHLLQTLDKQRIRLVISIFRAITLPPVDKFIQICIATHTDKAHIHNHLIINTYGINGHKFNDNKKTLSEIREISDRVCLAFDIQPIMNNKHMGVTYKEWAARRDGTSWKEQIRREIDTLVMASKNFDELAATLP